MLPILHFYGNHTLPFETNSIDQLEYHVISELRKIDLPDDLLLLLFDAVREQVPGNDISVFTEIENWSPITFPDIPGVRNFPKKNITAIGTMGMHIVFTPEHIILPPLFYERLGWYSPLHKEEVQLIRSYYFTLVKHFGGDHALYVDDRIVKKYYSRNIPLKDFEQTLITRYGTSNKSLFDYTHGKYPKYYIDHFTDIK
jgi:hypothetical protein